jgi:serine protease
MVIFMKRKPFNWMILALVLNGSLISQASAATRFMIKYKPELSAAQTNTQTNHTLRLAIPNPKLSAKSMKSQSAQSVIELKDLAQFATGAHLLTTPSDLTPQEQQAVLNELKNNPTISYAYPEYEITATETTNKLNPNQWDMAASVISSGYIGSNFNGGSLEAISGVPLNYGNGVVVAVIDSGYTPHPNFLSKLEPLNTTDTNIYGYQFISNCLVAGDCATNPKSLPARNALDRGNVSTDTVSAWHGTHVIGTIVASGADTIVNGRTGVSGGAPGARILPIRVLGDKGKGNSFDMLFAMLWAVGESVSNVADLPLHPARVINLSLGVDAESCDQLTQDVINYVTSKGAIVVVAASNDSKDVSKSMPANCNNVISVAAVGPRQSLAYYSNFGQVTIAAAGGDARYGSNGLIYSTICTDSYTNTRCTFSNGSGFSFDTKQGTSMAAPHVSAAVAAMLAVNPNLAINQVISLLRTTQTPFSGSNHCNSGCLSDGVGMLNAAAAIKAAESGATPDPTPTLTPAPGPTPTPAPLFSAGGGGGCTMVADNDDYGLILILTCVGLLYWARNKK